MSIFRRTSPSWEHEELECLIADVSPDLLAYLARRVRPAEDAADILADTLLTVWRRRAELPPTCDRARAWMFVTARNHLMNHHRGRARRLALADRLRDQLVSYDETIHGGHGHEQQVRDALQLLPEQDQELITLIIWDGFGVAEAGVLIGLSASSARSRYQRAKARFARALAELD